jgi:hypothetical protein
MLAQRFGVLRSRRMKTAVKSPEQAVYRRGLGIFLTETPSTDRPKHLFRPLFPRNPHFPALRSDSMALSGASRQKQIPKKRNPELPLSPVIRSLQIQIILESLPM